VVLILPEALKPCGNHRALPDGGRRKKRGIDFAIPKHTGIRALMEYGFRESSIELGSPAPFSVVNPEDAVQIIGGRPVTGPKTSGDTPGEKSESPGRRNAIFHFPLIRQNCLDFRGADPLVCARPPGHAAATTKPVEMPAPL
jgi:hypothetical protein